MPAPLNDANAAGIGWFATSAITLKKNSFMIFILSQFMIGNHFPFFLYKDKVY
jgi:hypothetical protein